MLNRSNVCVRTNFSKWSLHFVMACLPKQFFRVFFFFFNCGVS